MAAHHSSRKVRTYQSLYRINRAFVTITRHCLFIERAGFIPIARMRVLDGLVRELQAQVNHTILDRMYGVEDEDRFRYGRIRSDWEHHLNPKRPAFGQRKQ
jgi:hypothetical protein